MKVVSIKPAGKREVFDLSVAGPESYVTADGTVHHNTGNLYAADNIFFLGRRQDATGQGASKNLKGYEFVVKVFKSRHTREESKFYITVGFEKGISINTGMFEILDDIGLMVKEGKDTYAFTDPTTGEVSDPKRKSWWESNDTFWDQICENAGVVSKMEDAYRLESNTLFQSGDENGV